MRCGVNCHQTHQTLGLYCGKMPIFSIWILIRYCRIYVTDKIITRQLYKLRDIFASGGICEAKTQ